MISQLRVRVPQLPVKTGQLSAKVAYLSLVPVNVASLDRQENWLFDLDGEGDRLRS